MKSRSIIFIVILIAVVALLIFLKPKNENASGKSASNKNRGNSPVAVNIYVVKQMTLDNTIYVTGNILANEQADLRSEINGRIVKILFREGSKVNKGDVLVKIFDEDLQAQLKKLNYQKELAELNESRQKKLLAANGISQEEYDQTLNALNQVKADIDLVKAQIEKTQITAPFSGIIGLRNVSEGSYVSTATIVASIVQLDPVKIEFSIPERYADMLSAGSKINFRLNSSDKEHPATVYAIEPKIDQAAGILKVRATCPNPDNKIIPGSFVNITVNLKQYDDAVIIPTQAVIPQLKGNKVFLCKDGKAFSQDVTIGVRNDTIVQVLQGVNAGDSVLTTGILAVRQGTPLKILK